MAGVQSHRQRIHAGTDRVPARPRSKVGPNSCTALPLTLILSVLRARGWPMALFDRVVTCCRLPKDLELVRPMIDLATKMLTMAPAHRISTHAALDHAVFWSTPSPAPIPRYVGQGSYPRLLSAIRSGLLPSDSKFERRIDVSPRPPATQQHRPQPHSGHHTHGAAKHAHDGDHRDPKRANKH